LEFDYEFIPDLTPSEIDQSSPDKSLKASKIERQLAGENQELKQQQITLQIALNEKESKV